MNSILLYIIGALLLANGVLAFLWQRAKRKLVEAIAKGEKEARDIESKATNAMVEGLENESKVTGSALNDDDVI